MVIFLLYVIVVVSTPGHQYSSVISLFSCFLGPNGDVLELREAVVYIVICISTSWRTVTTEPYSKGHQYGVTITLLSS